MPNLGELSGPVVFAAAGLEADHAARQVGEEHQYIAARQPLPQHHVAVLFDAMDLKHRLRDVEADGGNLHCGRLPCSWLLIAPTLGTSMPSAGGVQLDLFADRASAATLRANQLRLWFASFAYVLL